ncbi:MAG: hypothetical protein ACTSRU_06540 [Candidatus Hodarchaeales archaeon]
MLLDEYLDYLQESILTRAERRYRTIKKLELRRHRDKLKIKLAALKRSKAIKPGAAKRAKDKLSKLQMFKRSNAAKRVKGTRIYPVAKFVKKAGSK